MTTLGSIKEIRAKIGRMLAGDLLRNLGRYSVGTGSAQVIMMIYALVVARVLGPAGYGVFSGSYALTGLSAFLFNLGMDTLLLREPGSLRSPRDWAGRVLQVKTVLGLAWGVALVTGATLVRPDIFSLPMMMICAFDVWSDGALNTHISALNIQKRFTAVSRIIFFSRAARLLGILILPAGFASPVTFAAARCLATFLGLGAAFLAVRPRLLPRDTPPFQQIMRSAVPYGLSDFLAVIYMQSDVTLLVIMAGSAAAGLYSPASGLINALFVIPSTIFLLVLPILARQVQDQPARLNSSLKRITLGFLGIGLLLAVFIGVIGSSVLSLVLGPKYAASFHILTLLSPLLLFKSLGFGWAAFLVAVGWQRRRLIPQAVSAAANILLNIIAIPRFGIEGVAVVYVITEIILSVGYGNLVVKWWRSQKT